MPTLDDGPWRKFLGQMIREYPQTRNLLEEGLNIQEVTVSRWIRGERTPKPPTLRRLHEFLPMQHQEHFKQLLMQSYPDLLFPDLIASSNTAESEREGTKTPLLAPTRSLFSHRDLEEIIEIVRSRTGEIPSSFALRLIGAASTSEESLLFWVVSRYITQQLKHLLGEAIQVLFFRCLSNERGQIASLYHGISQPLDAFAFPLFLGGNHRPARALFSQQPLIIYDEESGVAHGCTVSLQRRGKIAGCLVILSELSQIFTSPERQDLLQWYGFLAALAFTDTQFYLPAVFALANMPSWEQQRERFHASSFDERFRKARDDHPNLNQQDLEVIVLQDLERELVQIQKAGHYDR